MLGELGETHQLRRVREEFAAKPRMKNRNWLCIKEETRGNVPGVGNSVCHRLAAGENKPFQRPLQGAQCGVLEGVGERGVRQTAEFRRANARLELTMWSRMLLAVTLRDHFHCVLEAEVAAFLLRLSTVDFSRK